MTKEELIKFLKENLRLELDESHLSYGSSGSYTIKLMLDDEEISEISISKNDGNEQYN